MAKKASEFIVKEIDGEFCVIAEDGKSLGCFPTADEANERLRQVEAAKAAKASAEDDPSRTYNHDLDGVEIFRTGTWNGDKYDIADLDDIVSAFDKVGFRPPVKLGHKEKSGDPAHGWVASLRRVGDRLLANLSDLPDRVHDAIKARRFDAVSSEIFWNLKRDGKTFRRALKAIALLGAEIPAVSGLKPLRDSFAGLKLADVGNAEIHVYQIGKESLMADENKKADEAAAKAHADELAKRDDEVKKLTADLAALKKSHETKGDEAIQIKTLQEQVADLVKTAASAVERERKAVIAAKVDKLRIPSLRTHVAALYDLATSVDADKTVKFAVLDGDEVKEKDVNPTAVVDDLVLRLNRHSEKLFTQLGHAGDMNRDDHPSEDDPGEEVDRLVKARMGKHDKETYETAFAAVSEDPENRELIQAYAQSR